MMNKIRGWFDKEPVEEVVETLEEVTIEEPENKEFEMRPEVPGVVREEDIVKKTADGEDVPSFL